jgi:ubiquinone/menaquinone biosynthesis C-methylase UbiE
MVTTTYSDLKPILNRLKAKAEHRQREGRPLASNRLHMIRAMETEAILKSIQSYGGEWALDIGCGNGYQAFLLERIYKNVVASDVEMVENPDKFDMVCDAHRVPFAPSSFDLVLLSNVLEHVENRRQVVEESLRILREDGVLVVTVPSVLWKVIEIMTYYVDIAHIVICEDFSAGRESHVQDPELKADTAETTRRFLWSYVLPGTHGLYRGNVDEILSYRVSAWLEILSRAGNIRVTTARLPIYPSKSLRIGRRHRLLQSLGLSSSNCFIVTKIHN